MEKIFKESEVWLITGSQHLYGEQVLRQVEEHARAIVAHLHHHAGVPAKIIYKPVVKSPEEIVTLFQEANAARNCISLILWMHTFSPAKMWINGLKISQQPILHLHTQYNRDIPFDAIDMDFMNLNQSAHGDREAGYIMTRMNIRRKVITGHWKDERVIKKINSWIRAAAGWHDWQGAKFVRFGDNMRYVAVTEGDKVEAEIKFGYSVNTHGTGDLVQAIGQVTPQDITHLCEQYEELYRVSDKLKKDGSARVALDEAAKIEIGLRNFLQSGNFKGFTDTFEDLHGLVQLPGIAAQRLMNDGYGFGAEGDWKTAALVRAMKVMAAGLPGGNSFMEDYTYHFEPGNEMVLGAHMLEICPSIAKGKPSCEVHPLGIGGKSDPVRLVFDVSGGKALNASVVDIGSRFRLLVNEVHAVEHDHEMPKLPVARVLWKPQPDMYTGCEAWLLAGGAHHTCYSQNVSVEMLEDFAEIAGIEMVLINEATTIRQLKQELKMNDLIYK